MKPSHTRVTAASIATESIDCKRAREILSLIGDKWSILLVTLLKDGSLRFSDLKRQIDGISQRMLTLTLRGLERDGLVTRTVTPTTPPRVDYELTDLGHSLPVEALRSWAFSNADAIDRARSAFDKRESNKARPSAVSTGIYRIRR